MPYLPEPCFNLIKRFAGIHPAKFHQKKIATMIDHSVDYWNQARLCGEVIPLVYEIHFGEKWIEDWEAGFPNINEEVWQDMNDYHEAIRSLNDFKFTQSFEIYSIAWNKVYTKQSHNQVWLKLTTKPTSNYFGPGAGDFSRSFWPMNVTEMKQFCIDNKMPKQIYSNLNKPDLISLIQHYNFD